MTCHVGWDVNRRTRSWEMDETLMVNIAAGEGLLGHWKIIVLNHCCCYYYLYIFFSVEKIVFCRVGVCLQAEVHSTWWNTTGRNSIPAKATMRTYSQALRLEPSLPGCIISPTRCSSKRHRFGWRLCALCEVVVSTRPWMYLKFIFHFLVPLKMKLVVEWPWVLRKIFEFNFLKPCRLVGRIWCKDVINSCIWNGE